MWNDKETDLDLLGHEKIAETVLEIVSDNHLRPLTIGVYGDWGVGKSSVLSLLQKNLDKRKESGEMKAHYILFNGWLFQGYEDAKTALMETIVTELAKIQPNHEKVKKLARSLLKRVNWLKVAKVSASALFTGLSGIPDLGVLGGAFNMLKKGKELIGHEKGKDDEEGFLKEAEEETVTGQIRAFRKEFKELVHESKVEHVVVLVDDLDRCLPKAVIEILEAIRLFLFVEGTTFIISADEKMIEYAVREHFPNLPVTYTEYTRNYLEKLIQIPIRIPTLNTLQTANYIKFLMLQNYLKHDYTKLEKVYENYNAKKKTPFDNLPLSYEIITEALSAKDTHLKETILVGDQLSPTLSLGLKGNPRNTKRFLNTLFLRMRIAKIYGLESTIKLNVLAKLMLLERFQPDRFDALVNEISVTPDGISQLLKNAEVHKKEETDVTDEKAPSNDNKFTNWKKLEPLFGAVDLRPYIFVSKEKAVGFDADSTFPEHLSKILDKLNGGSDILIKEVEKELAEIPIQDATLLFNRLEVESRSADLKKLPTSIKGLLKLVEIHTALEDRLVKHMSTYPSDNLGVWAVSQLTGLKTPQAHSLFKELLQSWAQSDNKALKAIAGQTLKTI